jgi:hypothetical protein
MCNNNFSIENKRWWPKCYKRNTISVHTYGEAVSRAQKFNFSILRYYMCADICHRPGEITTDFIDGFITNNFRLISVPNKILDLPNEKADIKQAMKYNDHDHQDFSTLAWEKNQHRA